MRKDLGYKPRSEALSRCGFSCYSEYLFSDLWKSIRLRVLERDHWTCVVCEYPATQVHHLSYADAVLLGERIDKLVSVCAPCHFKIEFAGNGNKLPLAKAVKKLEKLKKWHRKRKRREAHLLARELLADD